MRPDFLHVAKTKSRKPEIQTGPSISSTARRQVERKMNARVQSVRTTAVSALQLQLDPLSGHSSAELPRYSQVPHRSGCASIRHDNMTAVNTLFPFSCRTSSSSPLFTGLGPVHAQDVHLESQPAHDVLGKCLTYVVVGPSSGLHIVGCRARMSPLGTGRTGMDFRACVAFQGQRLLPGDFPQSGWRISRPTRTRYVISSHLQRDILDVRSCNLCACPFYLHVNITEARSGVWRFFSRVSLRVIVALAQV